MREKIPCREHDVPYKRPPPRTLIFKQQKTMYFFLKLKYIK